MWIRVTIRPRLIPLTFAAVLQPLFSCEKSVAVKVDPGDTPRGHGVCSQEDGTRRKMSPGRLGRRHSRCLQTGCPAMGGMS